VPSGASSGTPAWRPLIRQQGSVQHPRLLLTQPQAVPPARLADSPGVRWWGARGRRNRTTNVRSASCLWPRQCDSAKSPQTAFCSNGPRAGQRLAGMATSFIGHNTSGRAARASVAGRVGGGANRCPEAAPVPCDDHMAFLWAVLCCGRYATLRPPPRG